MLNENFKKLLSKIENFIFVDPPKWFQAVIIIGFLLMIIKGCTVFVSMFFSP